MSMKKACIVALLPLVACGGAALAQSSYQGPGLVQGVTESTDPSRAAAVERHAQDLKAQRDARGGMAGGKSMDGGKSMGKKHHKMRGHKAKRAQ